MGCTASVRLQNSSFETSGPKFGNKKADVTARALPPKETGTCHCFKNKNESMSRPAKTLVNELKDLGITER